MQDKKFKIFEQFDFAPMICQFWFVLFFGHYQKFEKCIEDEKIQSKFRISR